MWQVVNFTGLLQHVTTNLSRSSSATSLLKSACCNWHLQTCYNLNQLAENLWVTSFDNQVATSQTSCRKSCERIVTTVCCNKSVAKCQQTCCNLRVSTCVYFRTFPYTKMFSSLPKTVETVLNSSRTRTLFFCFGYFSYLPNEKRNNHPRKTRSAIYSRCGWRDPVKNLGDYEYRKPKNRRATLTQIKYTILTTTPTSLQKKSARR